MIFQTWVSTFRFSIQGQRFSDKRHSLLLILPILEDNYPMPHSNGLRIIICNETQNSYQNYVKICSTGTEAEANNADPGQGLSYLH